MKSGDQGKNHLLGRPNFTIPNPRNERELNRIRHYIQDNPLNWEYDRNNLDFSKSKKS